MSEFSDAFEGLNMPYSLENEQSVLGAILLDPSCMSDERVSSLRPEYFYLPQHKAIFGAMAAMDAVNKPLDFVTLLEQLRTDGDYEQAGGKEYLTQLAQLVPSVKNVGAYADAVAEKYYIRALINAGRETVTDAQEAAAPASDLIDAAEQRIYAIRQGKEVSGLVSLKDVLNNETFVRLQAMDDEDVRKEMKGISTGLSTVDRIIGGLHKSDLIIIGARPGMGKTSLILNMARHIGVNEKRKVAFFSLEMSRDQLAQRLLSFDAAVDVSRMRDGGLDIDEWKRISAASSVLVETNIFIDETPATSVQKIKAKLRRNKPDVAFIDYLQLIQPTGRAENRVNQVAEMTRDLKIMAKELNIPVVVCSQLSRSPAKESSHIPQLSDLRDSGSIEQDADIVMMLHRPHYYQIAAGDAAQADPGEAMLIVAKNRHGAAETARLRWDGRFTKFVAQEDSLEE